MPLAALWPPFAAGLHGPFLGRVRSRLMNEMSIGSARARTLGVASIWAGIALFDALQTVFTMRSQGMHHAWTALFATRLLSWLPWLVATPLVIRISRRNPPLQAGAWPARLMHLAALLGINLVSTTWSTWLQRSLNPWAQPGPPPPFLGALVANFSYELLTSCILYAAIVTITLTLDAKDALVGEQTHRARLNEALSRAQLHALQRQVEPHFMFNTLNAIAGLIREHRNDQAVNMVVGLSDFLRRTIDSADSSQVTLASELDYLQRYLAIQKMRFAERLQVTMEVPAEVLPALVPSLMLQPLVENAIKHGIAKRAQGGCIQITACLAKETLSLSICNDGPNLLPDWDKSTRGIGLANLRRRMQLLYGSEFELTLRDGPTHNVRALITLPFRVATSGTAA